MTDYTAEDAKKDLELLIHITDVNNPHHAARRLVGWLTERELANAESLKNIKEKPGVDKSLVETLREIVCDKKTTK